MNTIIDYIMVGLFILFVFFIFRGYHQSKLEEREGKGANTPQENDSKE